MEEPDRRNDVPARDAKAGGVTIGTVTDEAGLETLAAEWTALAARLPRPSLYLTHEWHLGWWRQADRSGRRLNILTARTAGGLAGIAPLVSREYGRFGVPVRKLELMTMEGYAYSPRNLSAELGFIVPPSSGGGMGVVAAFADHLASAGGGWDYLRLHPLPAGSPTLDGLRAWAEERGHACEAREVLRNSVIELPGTWDGYLASISPRFRKNLRHAANAVAREGGCAVTTVTGAHDPAALLDEMAAVDRGSWKHKGGLGLDRREIRASYEFQMRAGAAVGGLELWFLEKDGRKIAYDLVVRMGDTVESLRGSYDAAYERLSPGNYLIARELQSFTERGVRRVNFLWGDLAYKMKWSAKTEACFEVYLFNRTPKARALHALYVRSGLYRGVRFLRNYSDRARK
jgi:CelD/BcsL family acetyltransferase involved in cellulose biosynthesis